MFTISPFDSIKGVSPVTHFPVPNPPGIIAEPPSTRGKRKSRIRWPVK